MKSLGMNSLGLHRLALKDLWRWGRQLWRQSAIRLPRRDLMACDLQRGDRLRIGSRWWRIQRGEINGPSAVFHLVSESGRSRARLLAETIRGTSCFALVEDGRGKDAAAKSAAPLPLASSSVVHFPAGNIDAAANRRPRLTRAAGRSSPTRTARDWPAGG